MTAKELLLERAPTLTEEQAAAALRAVDVVEKEPEDPMIVAFRDAPEDEDDEPLTAEEIAGLEESHAEVAAGVPLIPLEQVKRELGDA
jgi:hypothetical protein